MKRQDWLTVVVLLLYLFAITGVVILLVASYRLPHNSGLGVNGLPDGHPKRTHDTTFTGRGVAAPTPTPRATARAGRAARSRNLAGPGTGSLLTVTAYCPTGHRTASGAWPRPGMAAGNRWPFGTHLRVQHVGEVVITDRIGWGSQLDLFMTSCHAARQFGRRHLLVEVMR